MADDLPKVNSLLEDERKQLEARKVMGQPPKFIVANGNPENPLLVNPQRIMTHEGRSTVVSGDLVANHPGIVYEREVFPPSECHVATFLLLEWLHQALEMETGNSLASLPLGRQRQLYALRLKRGPSKVCRRMSATGIICLELDVAGSESGPTWKTSS